MAFKALDIKQQMAVITERLKTNEVSPTMVSAYGLDKVPRLWCREEEPR